MTTIDIRNQPLQHLDDVMNAITAAGNPREATVLLTLAQEYDLYFLFQQHQFDTGNASTDLTNRLRWTSVTFQTVDDIPTPPPFKAATFMPKPPTSSTSTHADDTHAAHTP